MFLTTAIPVVFLAISGVNMSASDLPYNIDSLIIWMSQQMEKVRIPTSADRVYKDDCIYCFDTPVCKNRSVI